MLVSLMGRSFLSEVERPSILRTGLPVAPSLSYRLVTGLSVHAPAQRAGAQRLRALAHPARSAYARFLAFSARTGPDREGQQWVVSGSSTKLGRRWSDVGARDQRLTDQQAKDRAAVVTA